MARGRGGITTALALLASESHTHPQGSGYVSAGSYPRESWLPPPPHAQFKLFNFHAPSCCISQLTVNHSAVWCKTHVVKQHNGQHLLYERIFARIVC